MSLIDFDPLLGLGGSGPLLHFSHANGFPPATYAPFTRLLSDHYRVLASLHRPLWPDSVPTDMTGWLDLAEDLGRIFEGHRLAQIIGVGHSMGAVATLTAAVQRPHLFRALVLIEPVLLPPATLHAFSEGNIRSAEAYTIPLTEVALKRRYQWPSHEAAFGRFRLKKVFSRLSDDALWSYVQGALRAVGEGRVELAYSREWEARMYELVPVFVWDYVEKLSQPVLAIRGSESNTFQRAAWEHWLKVRPQDTSIEVPGTGHLLTMERPAAVAGLIHGFLQRYA